MVTTAKEVATMSYKIAQIYSAGDKIVYEGMYNGAFLRVSIQNGKPAKVQRLFEDGRIGDRLNRGWQEIVKEIKRQVES